MCHSAVIRFSQIYTFPIFPKASSSAGPSVDELQAHRSAVESNEFKDLQGDFASYGGHLNCYTFLKVSR